MDVKPGCSDIVLGTSHCDIWEITNDRPEPLILGHTADVYGVAWHPKKPYRFVTACEGHNIHLFNAKRRMLMAKVAVGEPAHSVAFSPNGAHLAVGTTLGTVKVLLSEDMAKVVAQQRTFAEAVDNLSYSPDGTKLAAGSHDNFIDVFDVTRGCAFAGFWFFFSGDHALGGRRRVLPLAASAENPAADC